MRFGLRTLLVIVAVVALSCGFIAWLRGQYYVQLRTVNSVLAQYPEIGNVWLVRNDDVTLEVEELFFSTVDQPGVTYRIDGIDGASKSEIRRRLEDAMRERRPVTLPNFAVPYQR